MANSSLTLSSLDFDTLKGNFKEFLKTQSVLKDYDFEGSNINVLLDVMAYNTYYNAFYLNMIHSEMFLDSAQKYDSVVSHSKDLNYVPRSAHSAAGEISLTLETSGVKKIITIPKGTRFSGTNSNGNFTFTTDETKTIVSGNNTFNIANLQIFEGDYFQDSYIVDYDLEVQRFLITNRNVDISSITVNIIENNGATNTVFTRAHTLFGLNGDSEIFFIQPTSNYQYEVVFGDNLFGRKPLNSAVVNINYRVTRGSEGIGVSSFVLNDDLGVINNGTINSVNITTTANSSSGADQETIESIRYVAPRYFATQQRGVSSDDVAVLIRSNFGGEISDIAVYGGQDIEPKLYGRIIISLKPASGTIAPNYIKNRITNYLTDYIGLPTRTIISDPDYLYCSVSSKVYYNRTATDKTTSEIENIVLNSITNYSTTNLEKFNNDLRYSRLITAIDNSDSSIQSNDTDIRVVKRITPQFNYNTTYDISVGNILYYESTNYDTSFNHVQLHDSEFDVHFSHSTFISSLFTYNAKNGKVYPSSFLEDDDNGHIKVFSNIGPEIVEIETIGSIDYLTGRITLNNINIANYDDYISLYFKTRNKDIFVSQNKIIIIDPNDVKISVLQS
jgi:hypothetical protein